MKHRSIQVKSIEVHSLLHKASKSRLRSSVIKVYMYTAESENPTDKFQRESVIRGDKRTNRRNSFNCLTGIRFNRSSTVRTR